MEIFKNIRWIFRKKSELANRDFELYQDQLEFKKEIRKRAVDKEVEEYRSLRNKEIHNLAIQCAKETAQYEHTFHSTRERLGIEIAKLEAKKEYLEELIEAKDGLINQMNSELDRLDKIINGLIKKTSEVNIHTK